MYINQAQQYIHNDAPYTSPNGTVYPANFPKGEIPGLSAYIPPAPTQAEITAQLAAEKLQALKRIDADTDDIYGAVLGNRADEYSLAASEAKAYKAAGYTGTVPGSVQSWATAKGWTAVQATDDILATAALWTGAQSAIRATRLLKKEQVRNATSGTVVTSTLTAWGGFVATVRSQLGV